MAGFYNFAGFNDDTRALLSIPARHVVARRVESALVAWLVAEHRLDEDKAVEVAKEIAYNLAHRTYHFMTLTYEENHHESRLQHSRTGRIGSAFPRGTCPSA
jgi:cation transport regulator ChaB